MGLFLINIEWGKGIVRLGVETGWSIISDGFYLMSSARKKKTLPVREILSDHVRNMFSMCHYNINYNLDLLPKASVLKRLPTCKININFRLIIPFRNFLDNPIQGWRFIQSSLLAG